MSERHYRSLLKAVSWRATGTLDTIPVSFLLTGKCRLAFSIGCVEFFTKIGLYYVHERVWNRVPSGRHSPGEDGSVSPPAPSGLEVGASGNTRLPPPRPRGGLGQLRLP
jgi:uncharacterized membrane protein